MRGVSPAAGAARERIGDDLADRLIRQRIGPLVSAGLRRRIEFPCDRLTEPLGCLVLREPEAEQRRGAVGQLGRGHLGARLGTVATGRRALEPWEGHARSILGGMRVLAITCAIAIAARPAAADRIGVVAAGDHDVTAAMAAAAGGLPDALGDARAAIAAGAVPPETLEQFRHVREQIDEAWRAYLRVQLDFAQSRLAAARTAAEALVAFPGGDVLYADAALRLGAVLGHAGRAAESQAILALALALDPDRPITLAEFSPDIVDAVSAVRAAAARPTRDVAVTTEPPGADLTIDGKPAGTSPAHVPLAVGQHVVVARLPLFKAHAQAFAVDDSTGPLALALDRDDDWTRLAVGPELGMPDAQTAALAEATLRYADLDAVILVASTDRRGGPTLLVQRCAGIPARCTAIVELGYTSPSQLPSAARDAWAAVRTADLRYPPSLFGDPRLAGTRVAHHCEACRSPWLWGGVGVAAVIATVAIIVVATSSKPPPTVGVNPGAF